MKFTVQQILYQRSWITKEILNSMPTSVIGSDDFEIKLLINNVECEPQLFIDLIENQVKHIEKEAASLVVEKIKELEDRFLNNFHKFMEEVTEEYNEPIKVKIPFEDWNKEVTCTKEVAAFINSINEGEIKVGEYFNPLYIFLLLLKNYASYKGLDASECSITFNKNINHKEFDCYTIKGFEETIHLTRNGNLSVEDSSYINVKQAFKFLQLLNFNI